MKSSVRLLVREQTEREKRELQSLSEQYQLEVERVKHELIHKKEIIIEKEKVIQDIQYKNIEILREKQTVEERVSNESKQYSELIFKYASSNISCHTFIHA